ncbi:NAD(P)/FAD-dependent oxidoreductase, partial [Arthrospira platensis SPKY2]
VPTGEDIGWSGYFASRFAGHPLKNIAMHFEDASGKHHERIGECMVTITGLEGSLIYALSAPIRDSIEADGPLQVRLDLAPNRSLEALREALSRPRGKRSLAGHMQSKAGIAGVKAGLLREV